MSHNLGVVEWLLGRQIETPKMKGLLYGVELVPLNL